MPTPFPGMDPWLEHPALSPDVHNSLIAAIRDDLAPRLAPRYYVGVEQRAFLVKPDDVSLLVRPDLTIVSRDDGGVNPAERVAEAVGVLEVDLPVDDEVEEWYLEVHEAGSGRLVSVLEVLSPTNKVSTEGRREYEQKRNRIFRTSTNLVEVDLLRAGEPMPVNGRAVRTSYRVLVARPAGRSRGTLYTFDLRHPIPPIPLPLLPGDDEPDIDLNVLLHTLYDRARYDLRVDYRRPPVPPLEPQDAAWARDLLGAAAG